MKLLYLLTLFLTLSPTSLLNSMFAPPQIPVDRDLIYAIKSYNTFLATCFIKAKANPNARDTNGRTALMWATSYNNKLIAQALINAGANIDLQDNVVGHTALIEAAYYGFTDLAQTLIDAKANIEVANRYGNTALMVSAFRGHMDIVKLLIKKHAKIDIQNAEGNSPLMWSAMYAERLSIIQLLLDAGAEVNMQNKDGATALMHATRHQHTFIAHLLIYAGAKLYLKEHNQSPLDVALELDSPLVNVLSNAQKITETVFQLVSTPAPNKQLKKTDPQVYHKAVLDVQNAMCELKAFAHQYVIVNLVDIQGNRPLHAALLAQNKYMVQLILRLMLQAKQGESVMQANTNGHTPVHLAVGQSPALWLSLLGKFTGYYFLNSELA